MKNNLAIVSTPGHYFLLLQYMSQFNLSYENTILLVTFSPFFEIYKKSFDRVIHHNWKEVLWFKLWKKSDGLFSSIRTIQRFKKFVDMDVPQDINILVTNQYNTNYIKHIINTVRYKELVSLDEGNAVFLHVDERKANLKKQTKSWKDKILGLKNSEVKELTYYTNYNFSCAPQDKIVFCDYSYSKRKFQLLPVNQELMIIIGSPYIESNILSKGYYLSLLEQIWHSNKNRRIIYFAHRREEKKNLEFYKNIYSFQIHRSSIPIELVLSEWKELPMIISSFYSAALENLNRLINTNEVIFLSYKFDLNKLVRPELITVIDKIYQGFKKDKRIEVIDL
jgi:hypothetical protein